MAQDGRPVTFIFKDKVFICFIFENTAFKYSKIQFEAFNFKECPASPFDKKNMHDSGGSFQWQPESSDSVTTKTYIHSFHYFNNGTNEFNIIT